MGEAKNSALRLSFDRCLRLEFHGANVTSDAGLLAYRELDEVLGLTTLREKLIKIRCEGGHPRPVHHLPDGRGCGVASTVRGTWTAPGLLDTRVRVFDLMRPPQLERVFPALPGPAFGSRSPRESNDGCTGS